MCFVFLQGMLSFLAAPLIGALSDVWGRKPFLVLTVTFTCAPLPLMRLSPWSVPVYSLVFHHSLYDAHNVLPVLTIVSKR